MRLVTIGLVCAVCAGFSLALACAHEPDTSAASPGDPASSGLSGNGVTGGALGPSGADIESSGSTSSVPAPGRHDSYASGSTGGMTGSMNGASGTR
jgi:hypothetical protein